jgi:small basic protein (TIGR04137 family)
VRQLAHLAGDPLDCPVRKGGSRSKSIHPSLRGADTLKGERSVLTRVERIQKLKKEGRFSDDQVSVYGLPKVRTKYKVAGA